MSSLRSCVFLLVILVQFQYIVSKPFLEGLICDFFCDDDDSSTTSASTSTSTEDYFGFFDICDCTPTTRRPGTGRRRGQQRFPPVFNMRLPPSINGMNLTMGNTNGVWSFNLDALPNGVPTSFGGLTTPPPTTAGGATTAAGTTAAATTAKK